jgi:hypothetical protein
MVRLLPATRNIDAASKVHKYGDAYSARIRLMA